MSEGGLPPASPEGGPVGTTVNFWLRNGSRKNQKLVWWSNRLMLQDVLDHTWIDQRSVRIGLHVNEDVGSYAIPEELWLLYDFRSGELKNCRSDDGNCLGPKKQSSVEKLSRPIP